MEWMVQLIENSLVWEVDSFLPDFEDLERRVGKDEFIEVLALCQAFLSVQSPTQKRYHFTTVQLCFRKPLKLAKTKTLSGCKAVVSGRQANAGPPLWHWKVIEGTLLPLLLSPIILNCSGWCGHLDMASSKAPTLRKMFASKKAYPDASAVAPLAYNSLQLLPKLSCLTRVLYSTLSLTCVGWRKSGKRCKTLVWTGDRSLDLARRSIPAEPQRQARLLRPSKK
jgi:hypothetical protein